jgi:putative Mn2+ efflux pump MntP
MTAEQHFFGMLLLFFLGLWGLKKFIKVNDPNGEVVIAARKGIVNLMSRWLK